MVRRDGAHRYQSGRRLATCTVYRSTLHTPYSPDDRSNKTRPRRPPPSTAPESDGSFNQYDSGYSSETSSPAISPKSDGSIRPFTVDASELSDRLSTSSEATYSNDVSDPSTAYSDKMNDGRSTAWTEAEASRLQSIADSQLAGSYDPTPQEAFEDIKLVYLHRDCLPPDQRLHIEELVEKGNMKALMRLSNAGSLPDSAVPMTGSEMATSPSRRSGTSDLSSNGLSQIIDSGDTPDLFTKGSGTVVNSGPSSSRARHATAATTWRQSSPRSRTRLEKTRQRLRELDQHSDVENIFAEHGFGGFKVLRQRWAGIQWE